MITARSKNNPDAPGYNPAAGGKSPISVVTYSMCPEVCACPEQQSYHWPCPLLLAILALDRGRKMSYPAVFKGELH